MVPMGRPKSSTPKDTQLTVRLDEVSMRMLVENAEYYHETRVASIRRGIQEVNQGIKSNALSSKDESKK